MTSQPDIAGMVVVFSVILITALCLAIPFIEDHFNIHGNKNDENHDGDQSR